MNVAPENLQGWKGDLDPYDQSLFNNGSRVTYTSVCSAWATEQEPPHTPILLSLNNPIDTGNRGQATISAIWQKVYPGQPWACSYYFDCPYTVPGCTANFTWDASIGVLYVKNYTSSSGVEDPNTVCLWYNGTSILFAFSQATIHETTTKTSPMSSNRIIHLSSDIYQFATETTIVTSNEQFQCCQYDSTASVLPLQVNPYYSGWGTQGGQGYPWNAPWPSVPWWWLTPFASSN